MRPQAQTQNYGRGTASLQIETTDLMVLDREILSNMFLEKLGAPDYQPPRLPEVALKLTELVNRPSCETQEIVSLLETDPMLMAQVLKIARSPIYSGVSDFYSLRDVVVRLGRATLGDIVMQAALSSRVFRVSHYQNVMEQLNRHSTITGHLAKAVCRYTSLVGEYGFLCGLLHDIGTACILLILADVPRGEQPPELQGLWPAIQMIHAQASGIICSQWNLPPDITLVVQHHHSVLAGGHAHPLAAVVCLAEYIANKKGFGVQTPCEEFDKSRIDVLKLARKTLRIDKTKWELIDREADKVIEKFG